MTIYSATDTSLFFFFLEISHSILYTTTTTKSLQSCPTLCDPIDGSPPGFSVHGILQARTLEWVAISFSKVRKWKVKVKSVVSDSQRPHGLQPTRFLHPWDFPGNSTGVGCHCLLRASCISIFKQHSSVKVLFLVCSHSLIGLQR